MNGVSEALLEELLAQARAQTQLLQNLAKQFNPSAGGGGGGIAGAVSALNPLSAAAKLVTGGFNLLSNIVSGIFKFFGNLLGIAGNIISAFTNLGKTALLAGAKLTDLFKALESIPILGRLFKFFGDFIGVAQTVLDSYRNLSRAGVTFTGDLQSVIQTARQTSLTLGELQRVVNENAKTFAILGAGDVQKGFNKFVATQETLMGPNSEYRRQLLGLGVTAEEAAGFIGTLVKSQGVMNNDRQISEKELAERTANYVKELDTLSRLTGLRREEIDAELRKAQEDQVFQLYYDTLTKDQKRVVDQILTATAPLGPEIMQQVKASLRGFAAPVNDVAAQVTAFSGSFIQDLESMRRMVEGATASTDGQRLALDVFTRTSDVLTELIGDQSNQALAAAGVFNLIPQTLIKLGRSVDNVTLPDRLEEIAEMQEKAAAGNASSFADLQLQTQQLGLAIADTMFGLQSAFMPILSAFAFKISDGILAIANMVKAITGTSGFQDAVESITTWIISAMGEITGAFTGEDGGFKKGIETIFKKIGEGIMTIWQVIKGPVTEWFNTYLTPWFDKLAIKFDLMIDNIIDKIWFGTNEAKKEERTLEARAKFAEIDIASLEKEKSTTTDEKRLETLNAEIEAKNRELKIMQTLLLPIGERLEALKALGLTQKEARAEIAERHTGTIGMTGNWWEKESGLLNVQAGETVLTQSQLAQIVDTAGQNNLAIQVERLNNLTTQMLAYLKQTAENTERTHRATASLNGNLYVAS